MDKKYRLTQSGIEELKQELDTLIATRPAIAEKLKTARDYGDLSENAEYHNARDEQIALENRIKEIGIILKNVELINDPKDKNKVELGNTVKLNGNEAEQSFTVVGSVEANPAEGKISNESPIGQALLGQKVGDKVEIKLPAGDLSYTIVSIE